MRSWVKKVLFTLCVLFLISNASAYSVSGNLSGVTWLSVKGIVAVPTNFSTYYTTTAILTNSYTFSNLPEGQYWIFAFQDANIDSIPELTELRGVYGGTFAAVLNVNTNLTGINIALGHPTAGGFDGHVSYSGVQSSYCFIGAYTNPLCTGVMHGGGFLLITTGNGDYFTFLDGPGTYYVQAVMDLNGNHLWDQGEPIGHYGGIVRAPVEITTTNFPHNVNITLNDLPQLPAPPVIVHDPLDDQRPSAFTVTATITDPLLSFSAALYHRLAGTGTYTAYPLNTTGNANEFAATLGPLANGVYEYYLQATDFYGSISTTPTYTFDAAPCLGQELAYDDGSAEYYNWSEDSTGNHVKWAVKFGPVPTPYLLYGARFAVSRLFPDNTHSQITLAIYDVNPENNLPGNLLYSNLNGTIGDVIGGVPAGVNWAQSVFRDESGNPLTLNVSEFFIAVSNPGDAQVEAFGRDTNGANQHRSYLWDPCNGNWFSEDSTGASSNAYPGNRMIRAQGFSLVPPTVVIKREGDGVILRWNDLGAPYYRIYSRTSDSGAIDELLASVTTNYYLDNSTSPTARRVYIVKTSDTP